MDDLPGQLGSHPPSQTSGSASTDPVVNPVVDPLVEELASKSDLVWVQTSSHPARGLWHVWTGNSFVVVTDGIEQPNPGLVDGEAATVVLRSRENRARQVSIRASISILEPGSDGWQAAAKALHPKRLNAPDGEQQPERWKHESSIWALTPTGELIEGPGDFADTDHRAEPAASAATTLTRTPFHAGRATKKRRRLSR